MTQSNQSVKSCNHFKVKPKQRNEGTTIIDSFPYAYGPEILELRLETLRDTVTGTVIVEPDTTFTGKPHASSYSTVREILERTGIPNAAYHNIVVPRQIIRYGPWRVEGWIRDAIWRIAVNTATAQQAEHILFSDHDEIPHPLAVEAAARAIRYAAETPAPIRDRVDGQIMAGILPTRYHEWHLNLRAAHTIPRLWEHAQPVLIPSSIYAETPPREGAGQAIRSRSRMLLEDAGYPWDMYRMGRCAPTGWHMTLQGGADAVLAKLAMSAHTELASLTREDITTMMKTRVDILGRCELEIAPTSHLPTPLIVYPDRWAHMLANE